MTYNSIKNKLSDMLTYEFYPGQDLKEDLKTTAFLGLTLLGSFWLFIGVCLIALRLGLAQC